MSNSVNSILVLTVACFLLAKPLSAESSPLVREDARHWYLTSSQLEVTIQKINGLVSRITSLTPSRFDLLPPTPNGLDVYVYDAGRKFKERVDSLKKVVVRRGENFVELTCTVELGTKQVYPNCRIGDGQITYRLYDDRLDVNVKIKSARTSYADNRVIISQAYDRSGWRRQLYPGLNGTITALPVNKAGTFRYYDALWDNTKGDAIEKTRFPYGILERNDRFFLWGNLDVNSFMVLTPNRYGGIPSFAFAPKCIREGDVFEFNFTYKVFSKKDYSFSDVCKWYAENLYSSNPLTKGIVALDKNRRPRTLPEGNVMSGFPIPGSSGLAAIAQSQKEGTGGHRLVSKDSMEKIVAATRNLKMTSLWILGCQPWDEIPRTKGEWYTSNGLKQTAKKVKSETEMLKKMGYHPFFYTRQLYPHFAYFDDKPRYKKWMLRTKDGWPFNYVSGADPTPPFDLGLLPEVAKLIGVKAKGQIAVHADFCNDEHRDWYVKKLEKSMDFYQPAGIAWDMGWDVHTAPCYNHPATGTHHGILRAQYELDGYLKKNHPTMRKIMNQVHGSPSNNYVDGVMYEGGLQIDKLSADSVKIYRTAMIGLYYANVFRSKYKDRWQDEYIQRVMRNLSYGVTWGGGDFDDIIKSDRIMSLTDLAGFSAKANNVPLVIESKAVKIQPDNSAITASVWADSTRLLIALYNDGASRADIALAIDKSFLKRYGQKVRRKIRFQLLGADGLARKESGFTAETAPAGTLLIKGKLQPKELLITAE